MLEEKKLRFMCISKQGRKIYAKCKKAFCNYIFEKCNIDLTEFSKSYFWSSMSSD